MILVLSCICNTDKSTLFHWCVHLGQGQSRRLSEFSQYAIILILSSKCCETLTKARYFIGSIRVYMFEEDKAEDLNVEKAANWQHGHARHVYVCIYVCVCVCYSYI